MRPRLLQIFGKLLRIGGRGWPYEGRVGRHGRFLPSHTSLVQDCLDTSLFFGVYLVEGREGNTMGVCSSSQRKGYDVRFEGLRLSESEKETVDAYIHHMDSRGALYASYIGVLSGMAVNGYWDVCIHFKASWREVVDERVVENVFSDFERGTHMWMSLIKGKKGGFPGRGVKVRLYGFIIEEGVTLSESFYKSKYSSYPRVERVPSGSGEQSPWLLSENGAPFSSPHPYYRGDLDLHSLKVEGPGKDGVFTPSNFSSFSHPEGCRGYQVRYTLGGGSKWAAYAQRHFVRLEGGAFEDPKNGRVGSRFHVLLHEIGHCFGLDDLYNLSRYPRPLHGVYEISPDDSVMFMSPSLTDMDAAMIRHTWEVQKRILGVYTLSNT